MTLQELQQRSHDLARAKGWWDGERDPDEVYANLASEISEAWEEYRSGRPLEQIRLWYYGVPRIVATAKGNEQWATLNEEAATGHKPEGFFVELADLVIRIADAAQAWGLELFFMDGGLCTKSVPKLVCYLHEQITKAMMPQHAVECLSMCVCSCFFFAKMHGADLWKIIDLKAAYNATREKRHGKIA